MTRNRLRPLGVTIRFARLVGVAVVFAAAASAHEPITTKLTFTKEISRILYKRCTNCHYEGGNTPISLLTYEQARPWAKAIRDEVLERRMPPWGAIPGYGEFKNDPSLTPLEIDMIVGWVEGGAPNGDEIYLPALPVVNGVSPYKPLLAPRGIEVRNELILRVSTTAVAITPKDMPEGASMRVTACRPDGRVDHLIWIHKYLPKWRRTYEFREPLRLPKGTRIVVKSDVPAAAVISVKPK